MDAYPLVGWKKIVHEGSDLVVYEGPEGHVFESLQEVYEHVVAIKTASMGVDKSKVSLSALQHFLNECCSEQQERSEEGRRFVLTTSTLEGYLHRGDHPVVSSMSLHYVACGSIE